MDAKIFDDCQKENMRLVRQLKFLTERNRQLELDQKQMESNYRRVVPEANELLLHQFEYWQNRVSELEILVKHFTETLGFKNAKN